MKLSKKFLGLGLLSSVVFAGTLGEAAFHDKNKEEVKSWAPYLQNLYGEVRDVTRGVTAKTESKNSLCVQSQKCVSSSGLQKFLEFYEVPKMSRTAKESYGDLNDKLGADATSKLERIKKEAKAVVDFKSWVKMTYGENVPQENTPGFVHYQERMKKAQDSAKVILEALAGLENGTAGGSKEPAPKHN